MKESYKLKMLDNQIVELKLEVEDLKNILREANELVHECLEEGHEVYDYFKLVEGEFGSFRSVKK